MVTTVERTGVYVYGIVPADVETDAEARGVGGDGVSVVRYGQVAALVSDIGLDQPIGTPDDLLAHEGLLDATAAVVPVLPLRFGAVLTDRSALVDELLEPHHDEFDAALRQLDGKAEYIVSARYTEEPLLRELIGSDPRLTRLRDAIRDRPEEETRNERIELGEAVSTAIDARRAVDGPEVADALTPVTESVVAREPVGEFGAADVAVLAETGREQQLVHAVEALAQRWAGRVEVRLLGPLAPYDFTAEV